MGTNGKKMIVLYLYGTRKYANQLTLEKWAFEYGLTFLTRTIDLVCLKQFRFPFMFISLNGIDGDSKLRYKQLHSFICTSQNYIRNISLNG